MIRAKVNESQTLALLERVRKLRAEGKDVASFAAGEPDFPTPSVVVEKAYAEMKKGNTKYVATVGIPSLRKGVGEDYKNRLGVSWARSENVLICLGAKQGIFLVCSSIVEPGEEIIVPKPYWVSYPGVVKAAAGVPVIVDTKEENNFFPTPAELNKVWTPKTRGLIFSSPNNPTGKMISRKQLQELVNWCVEKKVVMIYDELYERLPLDGTEHVCALALCSEADAGYIVSVNAFSKSLAMTGWRLGYVVSSEENIKAMAPLQSQMVTCAPGFIQEAALAGFAEADKFLAPVLESYKKRLALMKAELKKIDGIRTIEPNGAFYIFADVTKVMARKGIATDVEFCERLLKEKLVVMVPGISSGMAGWVRLSFATSDEEIKKALGRFQEFCC